MSRYLITEDVMVLWNPARYLEFADERGRPFLDLVARIGAAGPRTVVDLGCGPGQLTALLGARWPEADIAGLDSSPEMILQAQHHTSERVHFQLADVRRWRPQAPVDVIVSNATLQWVPGHRALLPDLVGALAERGWLAFQVPGNFDEPSHRLLHELAAEAPFADELTDLTARPVASGATDYLADLQALGCAVDAWETTYLHVLADPDPVFRWISGTGARPILQALTGARRTEFEDRYRALLRNAYPETEHGTVLPFRRVFVVAQRRS